MASGSADLLGNYSQLSGCLTDEPNATAAKVVLWCCCGAVRLQMGGSPTDIKNIHKDGEELREAVRD
ncbi:hypothetical protein ACLKA6_015393 [Drosophila palustris]